MSPSRISVEEKISNLELIIKRMGPTLVAFSGGVDSSFLLATAAKVLGDQVVALMTLSPSTPSEDAQQASALVQSLHVRLLSIQHNELAIPEYAANPTNRCYFCKNSLYEICRREANRLSIHAIADGVNLDDLTDYRPGLQAATEYGITHPLIEAQFTKEDIRKGSKLLGLSTWEKPASPCLASRVPYGTPITTNMLSQIAQGELLLRSLGFRELRVRHHRRIARIEVDSEEFKKISPLIVNSIKKNMKKIGFSSVMLDIAGYKRGRLNEGIRTD